MSNWTMEIFVDGEWVALDKISNVHPTKEQAERVLRALCPHTILQDQADGIIDLSEGRRARIKRVSCK